MLELGLASLRATVYPDLGGAVGSLDWRGGGAVRPVLASPPRGAPPSSALSAALFAMLPFANRAPGNRLTAGPHRFAVPPNTDGPLALHGVGWQHAWTVAEAGSAECRLTLTVGPPDYPFAFAASQVITVAEEVFELDLTVANPGDGPIPAGLGVHPYFPRRPDTTVRFAARDFWLEGPGHLPTDPITIPKELDFAQGRALPNTWRNNCYSGWSGTATIHQPDFGFDLQLSASWPLGELMLYVPPNDDRFALEPQSHTSGVVVTAPVPRRATGLCCLEPGEILTASMTIQVISAI